MQTIKAAMCRMLIVLGLLLSPLVLASDDPLKSPMWDYLRNVFLGDTPYQFDDRVVVSVPPFAEDPTQVPVTVDTTALSEKIEKIVVWADLNPIQHIYTYYPLKQVAPNISLRIKVQQATPIRAAVLTQQGEWLVGGSYLDAAGGGCTTPSVANASPYWESHLGEISAKKVLREGLGRYKVKVIHPMDTGLVDAIPEFYLQQLELRDDTGQALLRMELSQPVSENPVFSFDLASDLTSDPASAELYHLWLRDNNGNEFEKAL